MKRKIISIVVSVYNEQGNISLLHQTLMKELHSIDDKSLQYEIIFVNDGSKDNTLNECMRCNGNEQVKVKVVHFLRNFGHEIAMTAGLDNATGDAVIFMDGDLQHPPALIPQLITKWLEGHEIVLTKLVENHDKTVISKALAKMFYQVVNFLSSVPIPPKTPDFRLISGQYIATLKLMRENARMFRGMLSWLGVQTNIPYIEFIAPQRLYGKTNYNIINSIALAIDAILQFSIKPLRLASYLGIITAMFSCLFGVWTIYEHFATQQPASGYATIVCIVTLFAAIQMIILGIIGEYIGRIHIEAKNRPLYFAKVFDLNNIADDEKNRKITN